MTIDPEALVWRAEKWIGRGRCFAVPELPAHDVPDGDALELHPLPLVGALPGERVRVALEQTRWTRWLRTVEVLEASPERVEPMCSLAGPCPGCTMLHVSEDAEDHYKRLVVAEVFSRELDRVVEPAEVALIAPSRRGGHRVRAAFDLEVANGVARIGLRDRHDEIVHAPRCPANDPLIGDVFERLLGALPTDAGDGRARVEARVGIEPFDGPIGVEVRVTWAANTLHALAHAFVDRLDELCVPPLTALRVEIEDGRPAEAPWSIVSKGRSVEVMPMGELRLTQPLGAWSPPTPRQSRDLYDGVLARVRDVFGDELSGLRALDVGCATGGLSLTLARAGIAVVGLDADFRAFESAQHSAHVERTERGTPLETEFRGGKAQTVLPRLVRDGERFDVVTINPMRKALGAATMEAVHALGARLVIYIAPSTIAGAKDTRALLAAGYELVELGAANLHPGSHAFVAVSVLQRT